MSPTIPIRALIGIAVAALLFAVPAAQSLAHPCDETHVDHATDTGLQVQVDPETGTYSMPAPGTLDTTPGRAASAVTTGIVVTPGQSAAGGFKVTVGDDANSPERTK